MVNGVSGIDAYSAYSTTTSSVKKKEDTKTEAKTSDVAATYERTTTDEQIAEASTKKTYTPDTNMAAKLKADAEARTQQMQSLVEKILLGQANKSQSIFDFLGEQYSAEDIAQAKEDVSEDGYYGVKQTSQRILDFATALTGGDPDKIEEMRSAFEKGFNQAKKAFGGELPEISQQTYDAVMKGFDDMKSKAAEA